MVQLETTITEVSVYTDRARVSRRGTADLETGPLRLEITELPLALIPDSLRASARGTARARLSGVQAQRSFYVDAPVEQIRVLENQIEAVQDEITALDSRAELARRSRANLDALAGQTETYAMALASGEMSVESQLAIFDGLRARAEALDAELQKIAMQKRESERRLQKLKQELDQWRGAPRRERYTALVDVEVLQAGSLEVELVYVVSGAGWQPLYDLRLQEDAGDGKPDLEVDYLGQVIQRSGESWQDTGLVLSTARPALARTLPELDPWYIQPLPPPPPAPVHFQELRSVKAAPMAMKAARQPVEDAGAQMPEEAPAEVAVSTVESSGAAVTYRVPGTVSVPADGAPHKTAIARFRLEPRLDYVTAPKLVQAVYRRAKITNDSPYTLLPGAANLFAGEEFIGTTRLELVAPQGEIELYLGVDDRIKVERELKRREVDKRLIGGRRRILFGYEIKLENLLPREAKISLHDQAPVARHEDIKVKTEMVEPRPSEQTQLNQFTWEFTLAAKEKRTVRFEFSVEYPQGMELVGLP